MFTLQTIRLRCRFVQHATAAASYYLFIYAHRRTLIFNEAMFMRTVMGIEYSVLSRAVPAERITRNAARWAAIGSPFIT